MRIAEQPIAGNLPLRLDVRFPTDAAEPSVAPPRRKKAPVERPDDLSGDALGWDAQVVLYNDDVNTFEYVVAMLCGVFGHTAPLAWKIAGEAHFRGRAIAEVESRAKAEKHAAALQAGGLRATVEDI